MTSGTPTSGGGILLSDASSLSQDGGSIVIDESSQSEEIVYYRSLDEEANAVLDIERPNPLAHSSGTVIVQGDAPAPPSDPESRPSPEASPTTADNPESSKPDPSPGQPATPSPEIPVDAGSSIPSSPEGDVSKSGGGLAAIGLDSSPNEGGPSDGAHLAQSMTQAIPGDGGGLLLDDVGRFNPSGGIAVIDLGLPSMEVISYAGIDELAIALLSVDRSVPTAHETGALVAPALPACVTTRPPNPPPSFFVSCSHAVATYMITLAQQICSTPPGTGCDLGPLRDLVDLLYDLTAVVCSGGPDNCQDWVQGTADTVVDFVNDTCSDIEISERANAIESPTVSSACADKALELADYALYRVCQSSTDGLVACANNLLDTIAALLADTCMGLPDLYDGPTAWNGTGLGNECIARAVEVIDFSLDKVCQSSTDDVVACATNFVANVTALIQSTCSGLPDLYDGPPSYVGNHVGTACVAKVFNVVDFAMMRVCRAPSPAKDECINNLLMDIKEILDRTCGPIPDLYNGPSAWTSQFPNVCIERIFSAIDYSLTVACQSSTADTDTCINNLMSMIKTSFCDAVVEQDIDLEVDPVCNSVRDDPVPDNSDVTGIDDADGSSIVTVAVTPEDQVLIVSDNILQSAKANDLACTDNFETDVADSRIGCNKSGRKVAFARRIRQLAVKQLGITEDGMGYAPDVILLQQTNCTAAQDIAAFLNQKMKLDVSGTPKANYARPLCESNTLVTNEEGDVPDDVEVVNDTAILYLKYTMNAGAATTVRTKYTHEQACLAQGPSVDVDGDGLIDCGNNAVRTWRRHFILGLTEKASGTVIAVASLHLQLRKQLERGEEEERAGTHERKVLVWTGDTAEKLARRYPTAKLRVIAGDMNIARCREHPTDVKEWVDPVQCDQRDWWSKLSSPRLFEDTIYVHNAQPPTGSQAGLTSQYKNGCRTKSGSPCTIQSEDARIDFIFGRVTGGADPIAASKDLSCGEDDATQPRTCAHLKNLGRYSDHRLTWSLMPLGSVVPEAPPIGLGPQE